MDRRTGSRHLHGHRSASWAPSFNAGAFRSEILIKTRFARELRTAGRCAAAVRTAGEGSEPGSAKDIRVMPNSDHNLAPCAVAKVVPLIAASESPPPS